MLKSTTASLKPAEVEKKWISHRRRRRRRGPSCDLHRQPSARQSTAGTTPPTSIAATMSSSPTSTRWCFTGKKNTDKIYYRHTGHPGGVKSTTPEKVLGGRFPERVLEKAVERMLPKESPLARKQMTHLRLFAGSQHEHEAQQPETIDFKSASPKNTRSV